MSIELDLDNFQFWNNLTSYKRYPDFIFLQIDIDGDFVEGLFCFSFYFFVFSPHVFEAIKADSLLDFLFV